MPISSINSEPITVGLPNSVSDAMLVQSGGILEHVLALSHEPDVSFILGKSMKSSGAIANNRYTALSEIVPCNAGDVLVSKIPAKDANNLNLTTYIMTYKTTLTPNDTFLEKVVLASGASMTLGGVVTGFRIQFGRATSSGVSMTQEDVETYYDFDFYMKGASVEALDAYISQADSIAGSVGSMVSAVEYVPEYVVGTINSSGVDSSKDSRVRVAKPMPVDKLVSIVLKPEYYLIFHFYDSAGAFVSRGEWQSGRSVYDREYLKSLEPKARKFRFVLAEDSSQSAAAVTLDLVDEAGLHIYLGPLQDEIAELQELVGIDSGSAAYTGERIVLPELVATTSGIQGGCVYGDDLVQFKANGTFTITSLVDGRSIGTGTLDTSAGVPHCNSAVFGPDLYEDNDEYPMVYVNAYNGTGMPKGTCYVHRIVKTSEGVYTTQLVQTISIGFTSDPLWTDGDEDTRPYGNFAVDCDGRRLIAYTLLDTTNVTRFFIFNLPSHTGGDVTLSKGGIVSTFDTERFAYIQDNVCHLGRLFICSGQSGAGFIHVVDVDRAAETSRVNLPKIGLTFEPEVMDVYKGRLLCGKTEIYAIPV